MQFYRIDSLLPYHHRLFILNFAFSESLTENRSRRKSIIKLTIYESLIANIFNKVADEEITSSLVKTRLDKDRRSGPASPLAAYRSFLSFQKPQAVSHCIYVHAKLSSHVSRTNTDTISSISHGSVRAFIVQQTIIESVSIRGTCCLKVNQ